MNENKLDDINKAIELLAEKIVKNYNQIGEVDTVLKNHKQHFERLAQGVTSLSNRQEISEELISDLSSRVSELENTKD